MVSYGKTQKTVIEELKKNSVINKENKQKNGKSLPILVVTLNAKGYTL